MKQRVITLSSDFGLGTQGIGIMEATIIDIAPDAKVIHLMHGLPDFDIVVAARTMETVNFVPVGFHVCVVDPGVGTNRRGIIIKTKRGDYFIGPDNGVFISATNLLGGCEKVVEITNSKYMRQPVSPIFHGRDVFSPAAAHLFNGVDISEFGKAIDFDDLVKAPYEEAIIKEHKIHAKVIHVNKFGSIHLNILYAQWDKFSLKKGEMITLKFNGETVELPVTDTFGEVAKGKPLIMKDDYGRVEVALNMDSFCKRHGLKVGDEVLVEKK